MGREHAVIGNPTGHDSPQRRWYTFREAIATVVCIVLGAGLAGTQTVGPRAAWPTASEPLFNARDLTAPGTFSRNAEGPEFTRAGRLFVVNCERDGTVCEVHPDGRTEVIVSLEGESVANAIREASDGTLLLADYKGHNILRLDVATRRVSVAAHEPGFHQPNDLARAAGDVLLASDPDWKNGTGRIWRVSAAGKVTIVSETMGTTNGLALSPDGRLLYVAESVQRKIWVFHVTTDGRLARRRLFAKFTDYGLDGIKCDTAGRLYVTRYGKGTIAVLSPAGDLVREIELPGKNVSNIVFGGPDGRTAFVTFQDRRNVGWFFVDVPGR
jgi:sugar lactone lactonase YvrE